MSEFKNYIQFSRDFKSKNNWKCSVCELVNFENKNKSKYKIVCHHILPVKNYGVVSPLLTDPKNIQVVCEYCHATVCHGRPFDSFNNGQAAARRGKDLNFMKTQKLQLSILAKYGK